MKHKLTSTNRIAPLAGSIRSLLTALSLTALAFTFTPATNADPVSRRSAKPVAKPSVEPKAIQRLPDEALRAGLDWLLKQQHSDGGWGQGGGWRQSHDQQGGRVEGKGVEDPPDLGNTCVSLVTLLRAGDSPAEGEHRDAARTAFEFICQQVESADDASLFVTLVRDTQLQVKIGTYVDTFLAGWALSELKGHVGDDAAEKRRAAALDKVMSKIERNQREDGSFAGNQGWAAVLSQGLASKALNSASRSGAKVSKQTLDKDQKQNLAGFDVTKGEFSPAPAAAEPSSAGVSLYREAAKLGGLREKTKSNVARKVEAEKKIADVAAPEPEKAVAQAELKQIAEDEKAAQVAQTTIAGKLADSRYVAGFGNNGGEEFLSYMNLGESLHERGGKEWTSWKSKMQKTICDAQNEDGSWAGQHCITGRTFCTATALLTLLVERTTTGPALGSTDTDTTAPEVVAK